MLTVIPVLGYLIFKFVCTLYSLQKLYRLGDSPWPKRPGLSEFGKHPELFISRLMRRENGLRVLLLHYISALPITVR